MVGGRVIPAPFCLQRGGIINVCSREGCRRRARTPKPDGTDTERQYCSALCRNVDYRTMRVQRICAAFRGEHKYVSELWVTAVELSDKLTELDQLERRVSQFAERERGITREQWRQICDVS